MVILPNMAKTVKRPLFHYFFAFFHILRCPYHGFSGHRVFLTHFWGCMRGGLWVLCAEVQKSQNASPVLKVLPPPRGGGGGGGRGYDSSHFLRTENSFGIIWSSPRQLRVKNTLRVGHRGPVGRKTTQKPPQNTKKWKKIVKKRLFSRFGHFGQNSDFFFFFFFCTQVAT